MKTPDPGSKKKFIRGMAGALAAASGSMQTSFAKSTLDTVYYGYHIEIYTPINILLFLAAMCFSILAGGTFITNIKGKYNE